MSTKNIIIKDWRKIDCSFGLIYPNVFRIGMSSYSIRLLYYLINSVSNIVCERIFLPDTNIKFPASKDFTSKDSLRSLENKVLPIDFDILGFSVHFENDFKNILWILEKANIPFSNIIRQESFNRGEIKYPLIIGGGPVITSNPISIGKIFDLLFIGDAEPNLESFFRLFQEYKRNEITFQEFLLKATHIKGIYIPSIKNKAERSILDNLDDSPIPTFQLLSKPSTSKPIFENKYFIETNRGCPFQCKFCISSFHNAPFRNRSFENIVSVIDEAVKISDFESISLIGSCISSHPKFKQICEYIINKGKRLSLPSIRIEHITPDIIHILEAGNIKTITIAPEAGAEDLRYSLGKKISNEKIVSVLSQVRESKIKNVKLYFLIGLPNEKEEDITEIINLLKTINGLGFGNNALRVNINPLIPKLNTPYENEINFYLTKESNNLISKYRILYKNLSKIPS
ncbi:MAG: B12-binding domain-containing radical SAM protein, partial [Promethearchaeota archaeon]